MLVFSFFIVSASSDDDGCLEAASRLVADQRVFELIVSQLQVSSSAIGRNQRFCLHSLKGKRGLQSSMCLSIYDKVFTAFCYFGFLEGSSRCKIGFDVINLEVDSRVVVVVVLESIRVVATQQDQSRYSRYPQIVGDYLRKQFLESVSYVM